MIGGREEGPNSFHRRNKETEESKANPHPHPHPQPFYEFEIGGAKHGHSRHLNLGEAGGEGELNTSTRTTNPDSRVSGPMTLMMTDGSINLSDRPLVPESRALATVDFPLSGWPILAVTALSGPNLEYSRLTTKLRHGKQSQPVRHSFPLSPPPPVSVYRFPSSIRSFSRDFHASFRCRAENASCEYFKFLGLTTSQDPVAGGPQSTCLSHGLTGCFPFRERTLIWSLTCPLLLDLFASPFLGLGPPHLDTVLHKKKQKWHGGSLEQCHRRVCPPPSHGLSHRLNRCGSRCSEAASNEIVGSRSTGGPIRPNVDHQHIICLVGRDRCISNLWVHKG